MDKEQEKTQWHPAFCSAVKLELSDNKNDLDFNDEKILNKAPIKIDLLVIKKRANVVIRNEIGRIFKGHNLFEYKSPSDHLNIDTFYKGIAYACLYKAEFGENVNEIKANDITISFVREVRPEKMFKDLETEGMTAESAGNGIYRIKSSFPFDIQIIVSGELNVDEHIWLRSLSYDMSTNMVKKLVGELGTLKGKDSKLFADSVLQIAMTKNTEAFNSLREVTDVCDALKEFFKPELDAAKAEVDAAKAEVDAAKAEVDAAKAEVDAAKAEAEAAKEEADAAKAKLAELEEKLKKAGLAD